MFGKTYQSMTAGAELADPKAENKTATRVGQYKVSDRAIFKPDGSYLLFSEVTDFVCDKTSVHVSGCCAGGVF